MLLFFSFFLFTIYVLLFTICISCFTFIFFRRNVRRCCVMNLTSYCRRNGCCWKNYCRKSGYYLTENCKRSGWESWKWRVCLLMKMVCCLVWSYTRDGCCLMNRCRRDGCWRGNCSWSGCWECLNLMTRMVCCKWGCCSKNWKVWRSSLN